MLSSSSWYHASAPHSWYHALGGHPAGLPAWFPLLAAVILMVLALAAAITARRRGLSH